MRNSKGVSLIALIITIIVIIILAAIVMNASTSTVGNAQYAGFSQEFGEYCDQVALDAANIKSQTGIRSQIINDAQMFYMTANGLTSTTRSGDGVSGHTVPIGYVLTNNNTQDATHKYILQAILDIGSGDEDGVARSVPDQYVAYVIMDKAITNYSTFGDNLSNGSAAREFYGDSNGPEFHFVTSNGKVFTLPGYPQTQTDGTIQYHIDTKSGHYYVVKGNSTVAVGSKNVNNDTVTNAMPILAVYLTDSHGVNSTTGASEGAAGKGALVNENMAPIQTTNHTIITNG